MSENEAPVTILVIDDEQNLRYTLARILRNAGYVVRTAGGGQEALLFLKETSFDLIFLDIKMPDANGMDLLPQIRQISPDIPVLILTAHATLETAIDAVRKGARDYLLKPVDPPLILERIREVLKEAQHPRRRNLIVKEMRQLLAELSGEEAGRMPKPDEDAGERVEGADRYLLCGPFQLDLHARRLTSHGEVVSLSPTAFDYLVVLVKFSPKAVPFETLVQEAQGFKTLPGEARDLSRWRIHELRKALESEPGSPRYIITERGVGYRLVV